MKRIIYISFIILTSCTVMKKTEQTEYPKYLIIDFKETVGDTTYYTDWVYEMKVTHEKYEVGDCLKFKELGKKYIRVKKCK